jgi:hypothetical protein
MLDTSLNGLCSGGEGDFCLVFRLHIPNQYRAFRNLVIPHNDREAGTKAVGLL